MHDGCTYFTNNISLSLMSRYCRQCARKFASCYIFDLKSLSKLSARNDVQNCANLVTYWYYGTFSQTRRMYWWIGMSWRRQHGTPKDSSRMISSYQSSHQDALITNLKYASDKLWYLITRHFTGTHPISTFYFLSTPAAVMINVSSCDNGFVFRLWYDLCVCVIVRDNLAVPPTDCSTSDSNELSKL